jgi:hypothetical protein
MRLLTLLPGHRYGLLLDEMIRTIRGISSAKLRAVSHDKNPDARPIHTQLYPISLHLKG